MTEFANHKSICSKDKALRDYQQAAKENIFDAWDNVNDVMLQMPTGTGKTVLFSSIINDIYGWMRLHGDKRKILIIVHRTELLTQSRAKLLKYNIPVSYIAGSYERSFSIQVQIASIQTLTHPANKEMSKKLDVGYIIIDEAHHSIASSYQRLWEWYPNAKKLGVTATPWRMDHCGFTSLFQKLVMSQSVKSFIQQGYLSQYKYYSIKPESRIKKTVDSIHEFNANGEYNSSALERTMDNAEIRAQLLKSYEKYVNGKKGIIYAISRKHSQHICDEYRKKGIIIRHIDALTPADERKTVVNDFKRGKVQIIVNVDVFSEGFDCPDIEFIQLARPTQSLAKYLQQVGRGLRPHEEKDNCVILDNVGLHTRFGLPDAQRHWMAYFRGTIVDESPKVMQVNNGVESRYINMKEGNEELSLITNEGIREIKRDNKRRGNGVAPKKQKQHISKQKDSVPYKKANDYYENLANGKCQIIASNFKVLYRGIGYIDEFVGALYRIYYNAKEGMYIFAIAPGYNSDKPYVDKMIVAADGNSELAQFAASNDYVNLENIEEGDDGYIVTCRSYTNMLYYDSIGRLLKSEDCDIRLYRDTEVQNDIDTTYTNNPSDDDMELIYEGNYNDSQQLTQEKSSLKTNNIFVKKRGEIKLEATFDKNEFCESYCYKPLGEVVRIGGGVYDVFPDINDRMCIARLDVSSDEIKSCAEEIHGICGEKIEKADVIRKFNSIVEKYWIRHRYIIAKANVSTPLYNILAMCEWNKILSITTHGSNHTLIKIQYRDSSWINNLIYVDSTGEKCDNIDFVTRRWYKLKAKGYILASANQVAHVQFEKVGLKYRLSDNCNRIVEINNNSELGKQMNGSVKFHFVKMNNNTIYFYNETERTVEKYNHLGFLVK